MGEFFVKNYNALIKYLKSVKSEIKRVTWPSKKELWTSTIMVTGTLVVVSIFVYFTDQIFVMVFNAIHSNVR
ncbi:MAG: preprotein translocase subunit SecE [Candidatus Eremiobacterota bacterium]